jgi:16S rRNA (cytosine967-C5)-methyltransferase
VNDQNPRQIALELWRQRRPGSEFTEDLLERALAKSALSSVDRALCQELVYGVVRWQATLDWLIARKTDGRKQKPVLQILLRLGLYQIFWLDRIPAHAAVHETVELTRRSGFGAQAGFVNAVLRGYLREFDAAEKMLADLKLSNPAVGFSHPRWLVEKWQRRFGEEKTRQLLDWNNTPPGTFARVNALKFGMAGSPLLAVGAHGVTRPTDTGDLLARWREENVEYDFVRRDWLEENLVFELKSHPPLAEPPSFRQGYFYIQDPSTLLAPHELNPQPGETVLDFCAAPGGKTTFLAQLMNNQGCIVAQDISEERLRLVRENCARLGATCVEFTIYDLRLTRPSVEGARQSPIVNRKSNRQAASGTRQFDRILIDAPCSNTGVMRRRVDLRWRIRQGELARLQREQLDLLNQAVPVLKPGGILVYSTCSMEPEENQEVVKQFLERHKEFNLELERELLPFVDQVDGAFVARLKKPA